MTDSLTQSLAPTSVETSKPSANISKPPRNSTLDTSRAYAALALAQIDIANEKGDLDDQTIIHIKQALSQHLKSL